jgi:hypothetical protein
VAIAYKRGGSPVTYIGEGNAFDRLYGHTSWLAPLLIDVPQLSIEIRIVEVARKNHGTLYQHIEADLLRWFSDMHGALPWFNKQWEPSKEGHYEYQADAEGTLWRLIRIGSGTKYQWAIQPTKNNDHFEHYTRGIEPEQS